MLLNLYRRHSRTPGKCAGNYPPDFRNYETDELRRGWKRCQCPIYADGTLGGRFLRKNTKRSDWTTAKNVAQAWQEAGSWESQPSVSPLLAAEVASDSEAERGVTLERAMAAFLAEHAMSSAPNTVKKYRLILKQLAEFAARKGYVMLSQFEPIDQFAWLVVLDVQFRLNGIKHLEHASELVFGEQADVQIQVSALIGSALSRF